MDFTPEDMRRCKPALKGSTETCLQGRARRSRAVDAEYVRTIGNILALPQWDVQIGALCATQSWEIDKQRSAPGMPLTQRSLGQGPPWRPTLMSVHAVAAIKVCRTINSLGNEPFCLRFGSQSERRIRLPHPGF